MKPFFCLAALVSIVSFPSGLPQAAAQEIIPVAVAEQHGLARTWLAQAQVDRARGRVQDVVLYEGTLYVQTTRGVLQAIDAETGQTLWSKQIGRADHPSMAPGAFRDMLATVNGSKLYVLNRHNGEVLFSAPLDGAPGAGPVLSARRVYVPMVSGKVIAFRLKVQTDEVKTIPGVPVPELTAEEKKAQEEHRRQNIRLRQDYITPLIVQSNGRVLMQPAVGSQGLGEEVSVWGTDLGYLNVAGIDPRTDAVFTIKFRLQTGGPIVASPTYLPPDPKVAGDSGMIFVTSRDGYVYAMNERSGDLLWKFSAGDPIVQSAVVIDDRLYVPVQPGGMFCLDIKSGKQLWRAADIVQFLAAGAHRIYAVDHFGFLHTLDAKNGSSLDRMPIETLPIRVTNTQTDRIYLGTTTGLLQCMHEPEQSAPSHYGENRKPVVEEEAEATTPAAKAGPKAASEKAAAPKAHAPAKKAKSDDAGADDAAAGGLGDDAAAENRETRQEASKGRAESKSQGESQR